MVMKNKRLALANLQWFRFIFKSVCSSEKFAKANSLRFGFIIPSAQSFRLILKGVYSCKKFAKVNSLRVGFIFSRARRQTGSLKRTRNGLDLYLKVTPAIESSLKRTRRNSGLYFQEHQFRFIFSGARRQTGSLKRTHRNSDL